MTKTLGILGLLLGWLLVHGWPAKAGQPAINATQAVIIDITAQLALGRRIAATANDNNVNNTDNVWVGFQVQGAPCPPNIVPGGKNLPCRPNIDHPQFAAAFQVLAYLSNSDCAFKAVNGSASIVGTTVPFEQATGQSGVSFAPLPELGNLSPGGICDGGGHYVFTGELMGQYILVLGTPGIGTFSGPQCAYMVNLCTGPCSCGPFSH